MYWKNISIQKGEWRSVSSCIVEVFWSELIIPEYFVHEMKCEKPTSDWGGNPIDISQNQPELVHFRIELKRNHTEVWNYGEKSGTDKFIFRKKYYNWLGSHATCMTDVDVAQLMVWCEFGTTLHNISKPSTAIVKFISLSGLSNASQASCNTSFETKCLVSRFNILVSNFNLIFSRTFSWSATILSSLT